MGFFIGASVLTVCEIVQYLFEKCFTSNLKSGTKKNTTNVVASDNHIFALERTTGFTPRDD